MSHCSSRCFYASKHLDNYPEQGLPNLVDAAQDYWGEVDLTQGGCGGGDGGDNGAAGEVHDGGVEEDGGHSKGGQDNHQPQDLSTRLNLEQ